MDVEAREQQVVRHRLLGWSFVCGPISTEFGRDPLGRDLRMRSGPRGRDLAVIEEHDNLGQALQVAMTTRLGDDPFDVGFGFDGLTALVEEPNPIIARERIRVAVIRVLRRDTRVRGIVDLQLTDPVEESVSPRTLHVRVVLETVAGEQVAVDLTGVMAHG